MPTTAPAIDPNEHYFAWWNVENLFDVHNAPTRPAWLQRQLNKELKGWTATVLKQKVKQLAWVIKQMNQGRGPDLLGVCEVENAVVLQKLVDAIKLPGRNYKVVHHDMSDKRGIDVAFIYDSKRYKAGQSFSHLVQKRSPTRDILQANFEMKSNGKTFVVIGNHWPSRMAGKYESEPFRIMAAETLAYFHERALHYLGKDTPVIVMGDFNDGPDARSLTDFALSSSSKKRVTYARTPMLYNLMWPLMAEGKGTYVYGSEVSCLDQILVNKNLIKSNGWLRAAERAEVVEFEGMTKGRYLAAIRFGRPSKRHEPTGFSDHVPAGLNLSS